MLNKNDNIYTFQVAKIDIPNAYAIVGAEANPENNFIIGKNIKNKTSLLQYNTL